MISRETIQAVVAEYVGEVVRQLRCDDVYRARVKQVMTRDLECILQRRARRLSSPGDARKRVEEKYGPPEVVLDWLVSQGKGRKITGYDILFIIVSLIPALLLFRGWEVLFVIIVEFLGFYLYRAGVYGRVTFDELGLTVRKALLAPKRFVPWSSIRGVEYEKLHVVGRTPIILRTDTKRIVLQPWLARNYPLLVSAIVNKLGTTAPIDERYRIYLSHARVKWKGLVRVVHVAKRALPFLLLPCLGFLGIYALTGVAVAPLGVFWPLLLMQQSVISEFINGHPQKMAAKLCWAGYFLGVSLALIGVFSSQEELAICGFAGAAYCAALSSLIPPLGRFTLGQFSRSAVPLGVMLVFGAGLWISHQYPPRHLLFRLPGYWVDRIERIGDEFIVLSKYSKRGAKTFTSHFAVFNPVKRSLRSQSWDEYIEDFSPVLGREEVMVWVSGASGSSLWLLNTKDFSRTCILPAKPERGFLGMKYYTHWSPDGTKALITMSEEGEYKKLLYKRQTGEVRTLLEGKKLGAMRFISEHEVLAFMPRINEKEKLGLPLSSTIEKVDVVSFDLDANTTKTVREFVGPYLRCYALLKMPWVILQHPDFSLEAISYNTWEEKRLKNERFVGLSPLNMVEMPPNVLLGFASFKGEQSVITEGDEMMRRAEGKGLLGHEYLVKFDLQQGAEEVIYENKGGKILQMFVSPALNRLALYKSLTEESSFFLCGAGLYVVNVQTGETRRVYSDFLGHFLRTFSLDQVQDAYWTRDERHLVFTTSKALAAEGCFDISFWDMDVGRLFR
jgi:hypothetical protein